MKLYTEEQVIELTKASFTAGQNHNSFIFWEELKNITPIELPSNEEIKGDEEMYYIQNGFSGNALVWWREDSKGYTSNLNEAGRYTKEFALNQIALGRSGEHAWLCSYIDGIQNKPVCIFGSTLDISERIDYDKLTYGGNK